MKNSITLLFLIVATTTFSQNIISKKYESIMSHTKKRRIERLNFKLDSIQKKNDSLNRVLNAANELISTQNKQISNLETELLTSQSVSQCTTKQLQDELKVLKDSVHTMSFFYVTCKEQMIEGHADEEPTMKNTCRWRDYQVIETGIADNRGRYSWTSEIFKKNIDSFQLVTIESLFKPEFIDSVETLINNRLKEDFNYLSETNRSCFPRHMEYPGFKLKDMRFILMDNSEFAFEVNYGLSNACFAVNIASATFRILELRPFLVE
jgi:hypothetical protein